MTTKINVADLNSNKTYLGNIGAYWEFTRPHTIFGTSITVISLFLISVSSITSISYLDFFLLTLVLLSSVLANVYIVGLNQIYDVEIDRINKPYLPLASGVLTLQQAKTIIVLSAILSILISVTISIWLVLVVISGMLIGTFYSVPQTRLKTNAPIAALSIAFVRGFLGNLGLYLTYKDSLQNTKELDILILFLVFYVLIFSAVIALFKDIPDLEGDQQFNIMTFTVKLGRERVFRVSILVMLLNYTFAVIAGFLINNGLWNQALMVITHIFMAIIFYSESKKVIIDNRVSVWNFYKKIWQFFYLEYIILVLIVLF